MNLLEPRSLTKDGLRQSNEKQRRWLGLDARKQGADSQESMEPERRNRRRIDKGKRYDIPLQGADLLR
jgi:hypothetical protein